MDTNFIKENELAYLTGLFDGEGCVFVNLVKKPKGYFVLQSKLIITNTNLRVLEWCKAKIGDGHIVDNDFMGRATLGHSRCFRFILEQGGTYNLLPQILPFSIIKKTQLTNLYQLLSSRHGRIKNSSYNDFEIEKFFLIKSEIQGHDSFIEMWDEKFSLQQFKELIFNARALSTHKVFEWDTETTSLLGTDTDGAIAERLGVGRVVVQRKRKDLNIKPFKTFRSLERYQ